MCMFVVRRRTPTASTMFETRCLLHYSAIWSTLSHVKNSRFRMKDAFSIFSNKHQPDFDGEDYYSSLVTFCVFYLQSSEHPLIADFESDAPSFWGAPWLVLMSEVLFCHRWGDVAITHFTYFPWSSRPFDEAEFTSVFAYRLMVLFWFICVICHTKHAINHNK